jgi:hypothetical protein
LIDAIEELAVGSSSDEISEAGNKAGNTGNCNSNTFSSSCSSTSSEENLEHQDISEQISQQINLTPQHNSQLIPNANSNLIAMSTSSESSDAPVAEWDGTNWGGRATTAGVPEERFTKDLRREKEKSRKKKREGRSPGASDNGIGGGSSSSNAVNSHVHEAGPASAGRNGIPEKRRSGNSPEAKRKRLSSTLLFKRCERIRNDHR